jgi:hypothetical protein
VRLYKERRDAKKEAIEFFMKVVNIDIPKSAIENHFVH